jgi:hypothetical protein
MPQGKRTLCLVHSTSYIHPCNDSTAQIGPSPPPLRFLNHTELDTRYESSGRVISPLQRPLHTQNTTHKHKSRTFMPSGGFEPAIPATKRPQTYALDRAATRIGHSRKLKFICTLCTSRRSKVQVHLSTMYFKTLEGSSSSVHCVLQDVRRSKFICTLCTSRRSMIQVHLSTVYFKTFEGSSSSVHCLLQDVRRSKFICPLFTSRRLKVQVHLSIVYLKTFEDSGSSVHCVLQDARRFKFICPLQDVRRFKFICPLITTCECCTVPSEGH